MRPRIKEKEALKTREIVGKALLWSKMKNKEENADVPVKKYPPRPSSLLLVAKVEAPPSVPFNPQEQTGMVGRDVELLECQGCEASTSTLEGMLRHCMDYKAASDLRRVHNHIVMTERCHKQLGNMLVKAYGVCGQPDAALSVFRGLYKQTVPSWTAVIQAMSQNGRHRDAFNIFMDMVQEGREPATRTYVEVLKSCGAIKALKEIRLVHACIQTSVWYSHVDVLNQLIETYNKVDALHEAKQVFANVIKATPNTWSKMMTVLVNKGEYQEVLQMFFKLDPVSRKIMDRRIFQAALASCHRLEDAKAVHKKLKKARLDKEPTIAQTLFRLYIDLGSFEHARIVFDEVVTKSVDWWETMVYAYAVEGDRKNVAGLYCCMNLNGIKYSQDLESMNLELCATSSKDLVKASEAVAATQ